jgi:hypothetical protein
MKIEELARSIEARLIVSSCAGNPNVAAVYAGETISDLIANAGPDTLLITSLNNAQLVRVADLMDVTGICLVDGSEPDVELVSRARAAGMALLVSPYGFYRTRAKAAACVDVQQGPRP